MRAWHLPFREWRRLRRRAYAAQQKDHWEVCGAVGADHERNLILVFIPNESTRPGHFEFSTEPPRQAKSEIRARGGRYLGIFHSHPIGAPLLGPSDLRNSRVGDVHLVYDVCGTDARLWRVCKKSWGKHAEEINLEIDRSPRSGIRKRRKADQWKPMDCNTAFELGWPIDDALAEGVRLALKRHKRAGVPIVVWKDGKIVWVPAKDIKIPRARRRRQR